MDQEVTGITYDSRQVKPGNIFVAIRGAKLDGRQFIPRAIERGAVAVVAETDFSAPPSLKKIIVPDARETLAEMSARLYGYPSKKLKLIGVTGTKGKTTTAYLIDSILRAEGWKTGLITTIESRIGEEASPSKLTTPEASDLQALLARMVAQGVTHVVLEVSSHALMKKRVLGCEFDVAVFTNISHEHLDFHGNLSTYFAAKKRLFEMLEESPKKDKFSVVNTDDDYGAALYKILKEEKRCFAMERDADLKAYEVRFDAEKMSLKIKGIEISTGLVGKMNVYNILAAWQVAEGLEIDRETIKEGIERLKALPGRLEKIKTDKGFEVIVDFAHSPSSLENLLETVRTWKKGKLILVFGCPGERDTAKRPLMGEIAGRLADYTIITTDDPYAEDPREILSEIEVGFKLSNAPKESILDRKEAIARALEMAKPGDVVVVAGRGHEKYQPFKEKRIEFDDRVVVRELLSR